MKLVLKQIDCDNLTIIIETQAKTLNGLKRACLRRSKKDNYSLRWTPLNWDDKGIVVKLYNDLNTWLRNGMEPTKKEEK